MDLLNIFRQNIDLDTYKQMLREVFKADVLLDNSHIEQLPAITDDDKGYYIGNKRTSDRYNIGFFYYEIGRSNVARKKVGLRNLVHKFINSRDGQFDAALVAFKGANHWRLSFICDIQDEATAPKRFTFVFGDADSLYRTPIERFGKLQQKGLNKKNIQDAFSVEALNDQFFADYKAHYEAFVEFITGKRFVKERGKWVEKVMHDPHPTIYPQFKCDDKSVRDYVKQMMGRIVFLHFLQKKGWMGVPADAKTWEGGDQNFMFKLFQCATPAQKNDFLDTVLEPLFFECLNTERERDIYVTPVEAIGKVRIPYLNGELFEKTELDKTECKFDIKLFENLFNLFNSYNFTIDENDPSDAEIGVDPEMLGKIFENLLEDNKDKGAFYTPKEIVSYMCKESLIAYLQSKFGKAHHDSIRTLVNTHLKDQHLEEDQNVCGRLNKALRDVKVCDPAIGSGAFPMGLLNEIFACRCQLETSDKPKDELKGEIIQNNIYGVDIERGAVDIARLRFWLALIVDAEKPVPLPNLDYKIMQGNSLLESYKGLDLSNLMQSDDMFVQMKAEEVEKDIKAYYKAKSNTDKKNLREQINFDIVQCLRFAGFQDDIEIPNTEFFLWHTYFRDVFSAKEEKDRGFDIVIGNPPYGVSIKGDYRKLVVSALGQVPDYEIYYYFIQIARKLLRENGVLSYIVPNTWLFNTFAKNYRISILNTWHIQEILDCSKFKIFESATVMNSIFVFKKDSVNNHLVGYKPTDKATSFAELVEAPHNTMTREQLLGMNQNWGLAFRLSGKALSLVHKIANKENSLSDFFDCSQGYIPYRLSDLISEYGEEEGKRIKNERAWHSSVQSEKFWIQEIYGRDITKFKYTATGEYVYYGKHVATYVDMKYFSGKRVVIREITNPGIMACIINETYLNDPQLLPLVTKSTNDIISYEVLWGLLNSKLATYYHFNHSPKATKGAFPKILIQDLKGFPIHVNPDIMSMINSLVNQILSITNSSTSLIQSVEHEIDRLVYELYGLTNGEVKIIDPNETTVGSDEDLFKA